MASSQPSSSSQKRKKSSAPAAAAAQPAKKLHVALESSTGAHPGPVLANFASVAPPSSTSFSLYRRKDAELADPLEDQLTLLAGETSGVDFVSTNRDVLPDDEAPKNGYSCSYLLAVHDPATGSVTLAPAPTYLVGHEVKRLKQLESLNFDRDAQHRAARDKLGEAFGTKKIKSRIRTAERNKIDTEGMEGIRTHLEDSITAGGVSLPTQETIKKISEASRPIPPPNMAATTPAEAYDIKDIIPTTAHNALRTYMKDIAALEGHRERIAVLPFRHSKWVNKRIEALSAQGKVNKDRLKMLIYIAAMLQFKRSSRAFSNPSELDEKMGGQLPRPVIQSLLDHFTETPLGGKPTITPLMETKLYSYMFVLCLMVDNFSTEPDELAKDLSMDPAKIRSLFQSLGCKINVPDKEERERLGITMATARQGRKAILVTPLVFKGPSRGAPKR